ncbi:MAG TPA: acriflavine resistance protein B [Lentisphaeria bacterium]|nr:MAG: acriflavine resistance protein B [Lentisphaerae bacterium GWF2_38_69]HBM17316.1 acriflavine resistance protein B [Lentisphaeria bacterium]
MNDKNEKNFSLIPYLIGIFLRNRLLTLFVFLMILGYGIYVAPFDWNIGIKRDPIPVDAIPNIGENQQVVFTEWKGRSAKDIENQITYPLLTNLMGLSGVKTIRGNSMLGFSSIYVIFNDDVDFYWGRTRILEKLNSLPSGLLPVGVNPTLGPDATALGQVFMYTLEGMDKNGNPTGGWGLEELRSIQDWNIRYALLGTEGVSEVASVGGYVKEYQIDMDPDAMRIFKVSVDDIFNAIQKSNIDIGANTIEQNGVQYIVRGLGYIKGVDDIRNIVVKVGERNIPVYIKNVANATIGPALRRGILDKGGTEAVGGIVTVRYTSNPLEVINKVKDKIKEISPSLPQKTLSDGTVSRVSIVPFYDRSGLIYETLGTLNAAVYEEILITIIVVLLMIKHLRVSALVSCLLPAAVLFSFVFMKIFRIDANIVALSGIAIAIGAVVDVGIILCDNILRKIGEADPSESRLKVIYDASSEVAVPILTSQATTIVSFLPIFFLQHAEGKLFRPLAFTKTFTLFGAYILGMALIPILYYLLIEKGFWKKAALKPGKGRRYFLRILYFAVPLCVAVFLATHWWPLGPSRGVILNTVFAVIPIAIVLGLFTLIERYYSGILRFCLNRRKLFLSLPLIIIVWGILSWLGARSIFSFLPNVILNSSLFSRISSVFPGLGGEFMPTLDEGSFLLMPTVMPHAAIGEVKDYLQKQDIAISAIPEIISVTGKAGRAETALDPAALSMLETIINYRSEYLSGKSGNLLRFKYDSSGNDFFRDEKGNEVTAPDGKPYMVKGTFARDVNNKLIPDSSGNVFRLWRPELDTALNQGRKAWEGINSPDDIWQEIVKAAAIAGITSSPKLQPIETRIVMLQSGMRAEMGLKIKGSSQTDIEKAAIALGEVLKAVPAVNPDTVFANRTVASPYIEIDVDREAAARYGLKIGEVLDVVEASVGGKQVTTTVEGRERYPVRIRYMRELRDDIDSLKKIIITASDGANIPLGGIAKINYEKGPESISSEDGFLIGYVFFDKASSVSEAEAVEQSKSIIDSHISDGTLKLPAGISYKFAGNYENYLRSNATFTIIIPLVLIVILIILYMQEKSLLTSLFIFSGIIVGWAGGFILLWLYSCSWFMNFGILGIPMRDLFNIHTINMSVAVWVGFLALFGVADDEGVIISSYIKDVFTSKPPVSVSDIKANIIEAGNRRVKACLTTAATTFLALIPVLTSTGRGSDLMGPMAVPIFGGLLIVNISMFVVPVLYSIREERFLKRKIKYGLLK